MDEDVVYKDIPGHAGYRAGSDGSIWSCWKFRGAGYGGPCTQVMSDTWKKLKGSPRKEDGRLRYTLRRDDGSYQRLYGSHFVLQAFVGPRPESMEACHEDGNCLNDSANNLRWDTHLANCADMIRHRIESKVGNKREMHGIKGEKHGMAKLNTKMVLEIRQSDHPVKLLAEEYKVSKRCILHVLNRTSWSHVE